MQPADAKANTEPRHINLLSQLGLVAAVAALVGASCCALPLALAWFGLAGAWIANLGIFVTYRPYITGAALIVIGLGWIIAVRRRAGEPNICRARVGNYAGHRGGPGLLL